MTVDLRDRTGAISPAEGCMFFAMLLFAALLVTLIVLAAIRFGDRPSSEEMPKELSAISYQRLIADS